MNKIIDVLNDILSERYLFIAKHEGEMICGIFWISRLSILGFSHFLETNYGSEA